jgi:hypothetical protein
MPVSLKIPLCGAKCRSRNNAPCLNIALPTGRCRFHGGVTVLYKHGKYTRRAEQARKEKMRLRKEVRAVNNSIERLL